MIPTNKDAQVNTEAVPKNVDKVRTEIITDEGLLNTEDNIKSPFFTNTEEVSITNCGTANWNPTHLCQKGAIISHARNRLKGG